MLEMSAEDFSVQHTPHVVVHTHNAARPGIRTRAVRPGFEPRAPGLNKYLARKLLRQI